MLAKQAFLIVLLASTNICARETDADSCNHDELHKTLSCVAGKLQTEKMTEPEARTIVINKIADRDTETRAYVVSLETRPSWAIGVGVMDQYRYETSYKIPISYPRYNAEPVLITHIKPTQRPAVIFDGDTIKNAEKFPIDSMKISQHAWGTKTVPQAYHGISTGKCATIMNRLDLKQVTDWKNTQLILSDSDFCPRELATRFDIYVGTYVPTKILRSGVSTDVYVPTHEHILNATQIENGSLEKIRQNFQ